MPVRMTPPVGLVMVRVLAVKRAVQPALHSMPGESGYHMAMPCVRWEGS